MPKFPDKKQTGSQAISRYGLAEVKVFGRNFGILADEQ